VIIYADVYDPSGNKLGDGPVDSLTSVSVKRRLDASGSVELSFPLTDERANDLIQNERRVRIYIEHNEVVRELGRGVIRRKSKSDPESNATLTASGPDDMVELTFPSLGRNRAYTNQALSNIVNDITAEASGWGATVDSGLGDYAVRFDGGNPLQALIQIAEQNGLHIRPSLTAKTIELGAFGSDTGLIAFGRMININDAVERNNSLLPIERIVIDEDTRNIVNWIIPIGGGDGDAAVTLKEAYEAGNRTTGNGYRYNIQQVTINGRTEYAISDASSISTYGQIEKNPVKFSKIVPISNSKANLTLASEAVYDAASAWLERKSVKLNTYKINVKKPRTTIRPGDKITLDYKGYVKRTGTDAEFAFVDIRDDFWVMEVEERVSTSGVSLSLTIASIDEHVKDAQDVVVGAIEAIDIRNIQIQPYPNVWGYVYQRQMDSNHSAIVPVRVDEAILSIHRCSLYITTRPFRSTASAARSGGAAATTSAGGGDHRHRMFAQTTNTYTFPGSGSNPATLPARVFNALQADLITQASVVLLNAGSLDLYTDGASGEHTHTINLPNHTHELDYEINDDTDYPDSVGIKINGVDRTTALGGPWGVGGSAIDIEIDIAQYIESAAIFQQRHQIELYCDSGQGEIEVEVEMQAIIQFLKSS